MFKTCENMQNYVFHSVYFIRNNVMPKGKEAMSIPYEPPSAQFSPQWDGWTDKAGGRGA